MPNIDVQPTAADRIMGLPCAETGALTGQANTLGAKEVGMNWSEIVKTAAVQCALIAALTFLARSIVLHWLSKDLEVHKTRLSAETQLAVEAFKGDLSRQALEHQVRFEALHANQVAAIEALYVKLVETRYTMEAFVLGWRADNHEEFRRVGTVFLELRQELEKRRIHLTEDLCAELDDCIKALWTPAVAAGVWPDVTNPEYSGTRSEEFLKAMTAVLDGGSVSVAIKKVERAFRKALREPAKAGLAAGDGDIRAAADEGEAAVG